MVIDRCKDPKARTLGYKKFPKASSRWWRSGGGQGGAPSSARAKTS